MALHGARWQRCEPERWAARAVAGTLAIAKSLIAWVPCAAALLVVATLFTASFTSEALAQAPATISASFNPSTIAVGATSNLTVTVTNPNVTPLTDITFSNTLPAGLVLVTQVGGTCSTLATGGGTFTINPGTRFFSSSSTVLAAGQSCNIIVRARGPTAGSFTNTTSTVIATGVAPGGPASANLQVGTSETGPTGQTAQIPTDSLQLRATQVAVSKVEALASGDAFQGAVAGAIADGFADGSSALITQAGAGVRLNFAAERDASRNDERVAEQYDAVLAARGNARFDSGLAAMNQDLSARERGFAPGSSAAAARADEAFIALADPKPMATEAPPQQAPPKEWMLWADVRGTGWNTNFATGDIRGGQVNAIVGVTRKLTPNLLIGILAGYENFDYTSQAFNGRLKGDGWTVGGYLGWHIWPGARFDAAVGRSGVSYDAVSGSAAASFPGNRWIASGGLTGIHRMQGFEIEPSAKVFAVWESDSSYTDSLGTQQAENTFSTGRASGGVKVAYPMVLDSNGTLAPYVGLYADYYFSSDNAVVLLPTQFVQGWAARPTAGLSYNVPRGPKVLIGSEVGGLGNQNFTTWSLRARASVPF